MNNPRVVPMRSGPNREATNSVIRMTVAMGTM